MTEEESEVSTPTPVPPSRRFWIWTGLVYALVNLPFLFLTLDAYNLNGDIYSSSYLYLGLNPYHAATSVGQGSLIIPGAGYFILPYNMVTFLAYPASGFSAIAASALLKAIGVVAGFLAARVVYEIAVRESLPNPKAIFYAALFNPFLIFVNSIAGDADVVILLFVVLAVFLFRYGWRPPTHVPAVLLGAVAISLTVLSYYFTLLLVPTLVLWLEGRRAKLEAVLLLAGVAAVLALPVVVFGLGSTSPSSLLGSVQVTGYSFPFYLGPSTAAFFGANQVVFTVVAGVLSVLVPLLFRRWKVGEGLTLLTVLVLGFALTFRLPSDVFAVLAGLVPLSFALSASSKGISYWTVLSFQAFLLPVFLLVEMFNGPGQVSGVFYWFYPYLHRNVILFTVLGGSRTATVLFALYLVATATTMVALLRRELGVARPESPGPPPTRVYAFPPPRATRRTYLAALAVGAVIVLVPTGIAFVPPSPSVLESHGQLNSQEFYAYDAADPLLYPLSGPGSFSVDSSSGTFAVAGPSTPVGLARNIAETTNRVNLSVSIDPSTNVGPVPLWLTNRTEVVYSSMLALGASATPWTPENTTTPPPGSPVRTTVFNETTVAYSLQGRSAVSYVEPSSALVGHQEFFAAEYTRSALAENTLWTAYFGPGEASWCFVVSGGLYLGVEEGTNWTFVSTAANVAEDQWLLAGFEVDTVHDTISASADNAALTLPLAISGSENFTFYLGKYNLSASTDDREAWFGNLTSVYSLTPSQVRFVPGFFATAGNDSTPTWVGGGNSTRIAYASSPASGSIRVNGTTLTFSGSDSLLIFGKLAISPAAFTFQIDESYFVRSANGVDLGWVVLGFGVLLPLWMFLWCSRELWISLRRRPSPSDPEVRP